MWQTLFISNESLYPLGGVDELWDGGKMELGGGVEGEQWMECKIKLKVKLKFKKLKN